MSEARTHHSKKDWWLVGLVLAATVIPLVLGAPFILTGNPNQGIGRSLMVSGTVTGAVVRWLTYPLYYQITSSEMIVRCGMLMHRQFTLASIDEVRPDRNPASAPAWSLDRLRVDYRKNGEHAFIMISPEDKDAFMEELARAAPGLEMRGARLVRDSEGYLDFRHC
jgi:hypothetical protein